MFQEQLGKVLAHVRELQEVDVSSVGGKVIDLDLHQNVLREDVVRESLTAKEALANAPKQANNLFIMPKIVE